MPQQQRAPAPYPPATLDDLPPSTRADADPLLDVMIEIRDTLSRIEMTLSPRRCSPADGALLSLLLPAVAGQLGSEPFRTSQLLADRTFRELAENLSPSAMGSLFSRAAQEGGSFGGFSLERLGTSRNVRTWRVLATG